MSGNHRVKDKAGEADNVHLNLCIRRERLRPRVRTGSRVDGTSHPVPPSVGPTVALEF